MIVMQNIEFNVTPAGWLKSGILAGNALHGRNHGIRQGFQ